MCVCVFQCMRLSGDRAHMVKGTQPSVCLNTSRLDFLPAQLLLVFPQSWRDRINCSAVLLFWSSWGLCSGYSISPFSLIYGIIVSQQPNPDRWDCLDCIQCMMVHVSLPRAPALMCFNWGLYSMYSGDGFESFFSQLMSLAAYVLRGCT